MRKVITPVNILLTYLKSGLSRQANLFVSRRRGLGAMQELAVFQSVMRNVSSELLVGPLNVVNGRVGPVYGVFQSVA